LIRKRAPDEFPNSGNAVELGPARPNSPVFQTAGVATATTGLPTPSVTFPMNASGLPTLIGGLVLATVIPPAAIGSLPTGIDCFVLTTGGLPVAIDCLVSTIESLLVNAVTCPVGIGSLPVRLELLKTREFPVFSRIASAATRSAASKSPLASPAMSMKVFGFTDLF